MRIRVLGQSVPLSIAVLAVAEAVIFFAALYAAALMRFRGALGSIARMEDTEGPLWSRAVLFAIVMLTCQLALGLYSARQRARLPGIAARVAAAQLVGLAVTAALFYLIPGVSIGRGVVGLAGLAAGCGIVAARLIFSRMTGESAFKKRVLVYGAGNFATAIANLRRRADRHGFVLVGFLQPPGEGCTVPIERLLDPEARLANLCERLDVSEVVVAMDDRRAGLPIKDLLECRFQGVEVTELVTFLERETGRVRLDILHPTWLIFGDGFSRDPLRMFSARVLDLIASVLVLAVSLPLLLGSVIAIKLDEGWRAPVFYRQTRVGLAGRPFEVLKFRSMRLDAEPDGRAQWAEKADPRVTRVGRVMRKLRIDELPQLINVLLGQMSFVGPRPERPEIVEDLSERIPYYAQRHCVKPGITGWAQLCYPYGSSERDALEKLQYDLYYIKNNSLLFELAILVQTAEVVLWGKGAR